MTFKKFIDLDNEATLYWLGFLASDGYIAKSDVKVSPYRKIGIGLNNKDLDHVRKFKSYIGSSNKIYQTKKGIGEFRFTDLQAANNLIDLGITPNKSKTLCVSPLLSTSKHFWRGVIDGDGHLSSERLSLCSASLDFIHQYSNFLLTELGINCHITENNGCYIVGVSKPRFKLFNHLYLESSIYLNRKRYHPSFI